MNAQLVTAVDGGLQIRWAGDVTWRRTASLREALFDSLERPAAIGVCLDVRDVSSIDRTGVALLIGANRRAANTGCWLMLIDQHGAVTEALSRLHVSERFLIKQLDA